MAINRTSGDFHIAGIFEFAIPAVTTVFYLLVSLLPYGLPASPPLTPLLCFIALFYWALFRPSNLPLALVFVIGLYQDLLSTGPLGMWALTYVIFYGFFALRRSLFVGRRWQSLWPTFILGMGLASFVVWSVSCLFYFKLLSPVPMLAQAAVTVAVYPLFVRFLSACNRLISAG